MSNERKIQRSGSIFYYLPFHTLLNPLVAVDQVLDPILVDECK